MLGLMKLNSEHENIGSCYLPKNLVEVTFEAIY
jgi:hypothetical protein